MDGRAAIDFNHEALKRILASLVAMAGFAGVFTSPSRGEVAPQSGAGGGDASTTTRPSDNGQHPQQANPASLPRHLYLAVLRLLRPAEAAARRLIIALARGLAAPAYQPRPREPKPRSIFVRHGAGTGIVLPPGFSLTPARPPRAPPKTFQLLDPPRRPFRPRRPTQTCIPRIAVPGATKLFPVIVRPPPSPDDRIDTTRLSHRFAALAAALNDLPKQAQRLACWRARNDYQRARGLTRRTTLLRWGRPPGGRLSHYDPSAPSRHNVREVDHVLAHCHELALYALKFPDTS